MYYKVLYKVLYNFLYKAMYKILYNVLYKVLYKVIYNVPYKVLNKNTMRIMKEWRMGGTHRMFISNNLFADIDINRKFTRKKIYRSIIYMYYLSII